MSLTICGYLEKGMTITSRDWWSDSERDSSPNWATSKLNDISAYYRLLHSKTMTLFRISSSKWKYRHVPLSFSFTFFPFFCFSDFS